MKQILEIPINKVIPDKNQPRKLFTPARLKNLIDSITEHGIVSPLTVEQAENDTYIIVDGERRYRAAKTLKMDTVPAIVLDRQSEKQRLIKQFHIQEQHEGWTAAEKALAITKLAKETGQGVKELCASLALPHRTVEEYISYSKIVAKDAYSNTNLSLSYARPIVSLSNAVEKNMLEDNKEWSVDDKIKLETAVINHIKAGNIKDKAEITTLRDVLITDNKHVKDVIEQKELNVRNLFLKSNASTEKTHRMLVWQVKYVSKWATDSVNNGAYRLISDTEKTYIKTAQKNIERLLSLIE